MNCGVSLYGRYCHVCGQENLEPKESVWHLVNHFFEDITHFDGKFFSTVKYLLRRPGFLSLEYIRGRRASYLNPIRMYVFTSAFFFLIFFTIIPSGKILTIKDEMGSEKFGITDLAGSEKKIGDSIGLARKKGSGDTSSFYRRIKDFEAQKSAIIKYYGDTSTRKFTPGELELLMNLDADLDSLPKGEKLNVVMDKILQEQKSGDSAKKGGNDVAEIEGKNYASVLAYDSVQAKLPADLKDGWFKRWIRRKIIAVELEYGRDREGFFEHFRERLFHFFPQILFISLPFFALMLKLLYARGKQVYYTSHGIFAIHLYCATFILMLISILFNMLKRLGMPAWINWLPGILDLAVWLFIFYYLYRAMCVFYGQRRGKTILKFLIVLISALIIDLSLLFIYVLISAITI